MSELADLLHARVDEEARARLNRYIEHVGLDPNDPEVRRALEDSLTGAFVELERAFRHLGIDILDALPLIGPWMLQQIASP